MSIFKVTRERKHCERCNFRRLVKVTVTQYKDGPSTRWAPYCASCDLMVRAQKHEAQAFAMKKRAGQIVAKRMGVKK